MVLFTLDNVTV